MATTTVVFHEALGSVGQHPLVARVLKGAFNERYFAFTVVTLTTMQPRASWNTTVVVAMAIVYSSLPQGCNNNMISYITLKSNVPTGSYNKLSQ